jgi:hypothetical protein
MKHYPVIVHLGDARKVIGVSLCAAVDLPKTPTPVRSAQEVTHYMTSAEGALRFGVAVWLHRSNITPSDVPAKITIDTTASNENTI